MLVLVGLEGSTAPYEFEKRMKLVEVGQVGQLQCLRNTTKKGTWPTWPTFLVMFAGTPGLKLVGLEDSTAPYEFEKRMKLVDVGQLDHLYFSSNSEEEIFGRAVVGRPAENDANEESEGLRTSARLDNARLVALF